jgi:hypothetical protein
MKIRFRSSEGIIIQPYVIFRKCDAGCMPAISMTGVKG